MARFKLTLLSTVAVLAAASCSDVNDAPQRESGIVVSAVIDMTRAGYSGVTVLPSKFMMDVIQNGESRYDYKNVRMVKNDGLNTYSPESENVMYWAGTSYDNVEVKAMTYPYDSDYISPSSNYVSVSTDQSTESEVLASDTLIATTESDDISISNGKISITFKHLFSKLVLRWVLGEGLSDSDITIHSVTLKDVNIAGYYSYKDMTWSSSTFEGSVKMYHNEADHQYEALFLPYEPKTAPSLNMHATVLGAERLLVCTVPTTTDGFESGKRYSLKVVVRSSSMTLAGASISAGWTADDEENTFVTEEIN